MKMKKLLFSNFPLGRKAILFLGLLVILSSFVCALTTSDPDLLLYYDFEEASGNFESVNGDYGLSYNGALYQKSGKWGEFAVGCDGSDDILFNTSANIRTLFNTINKSGWTFSFWVNETVHQNYQVPFGWGEYDVGGGGDGDDVGINYMERDDSAETGYIFQLDGDTSDTLTVVGLIIVGTWQHMLIQTNATSITYYKNGAYDSSVALAEFKDLYQTDHGLSVCTRRQGESWDYKFYGLFDQMTLWNRTLSLSEINDLYTEGISDGASEDTTPPAILTYNCTSCNIPAGDNQSPYETDDTTPTFRITTNESSDCRIGRQDENYTAMGLDRNCTTTGATTHTCTLTTQDKFYNVGVNYLYISCTDGSGNEGNATDPSKSNSGKVIMEIQGAGEADSGGAIEIGIAASEIAGIATIYSSQQVSARNLAASQFSGVFDKVAVSGNKRYAFNYISPGESPITGLFNITPVLYVLQLQNLTNATIIDQTGKLINNTYP